MKWKDRKQLNKINTTVKDLMEKICYLKQELEQSKLEVSQMKVKNEKLEQGVNLSMRKTDEIE